MQQKFRKNYNLVPRASYIFDVGPMLLPFKNGPMERSYKFRRILTLTDVMSFRILRMRIIFANMNFNWSHAIALQKLSNDRSDKFS